MFQDGSPFRFNERDRAIDYFGKQLLRSGYHFYGSEPLYSGITGQIFQADIYFGLVYYQVLFLPDRALGLASFVRSFVRSFIRLSMTKRWRGANGRKAEGGRDRGRVHFQVPASFSPFFLFQSIRSSFFFLFLLFFVFILAFSQHLVDCLFAFSQPVRHMVTDTSQVRAPDTVSQITCHHPPLFLLVFFFSFVLLLAFLFVLVFSQRLRHMVSDKSQVRASGAVSQITHQPIKGRKKHGGIRFGEMERDSLLAHGASFLLKDRLLNSSDLHYVSQGREDKNRGEKGYLGKRRTRTDFPFRLPLDVLFHNLGFLRIERLIAPFFESLFLTQGGPCSVSLFCISLFLLDSANCVHEVRFSPVPRNRSHRPLGSGSDCRDGCRQRACCDGWTQVRRKRKRSKQEENDDEMRCGEDQDVVERRESRKLVYLK